MPRQWFTANTRLAPVTDQAHAIKVRDRARLTAARNAASADELRRFLTVLALWPAQDAEEINAQTELVTRPDIGPVPRRPRLPKARL